MNGVRGRPFILFSHTTFPKITNVAVSIMCSPKFFKTILRYAREQCKHATFWYYRPKGKNACLQFATWQDRSQVKLQLDWSRFFRGFIDIFLLLASERDFKTMHEWRARQFFPKDEEKTRPRCVNQLTIGILGYGNMGKSIAKLFKVSLILYLVHQMSTKCGDMLLAGQFNCHETIYIPFKFVFDCKLAFDNIRIKKVFHKVHFCK